MLAIGLIVAMVAGQTTGTVISVTDADTIVVRTAEKSLKVRLLHIDAPEPGQAYSARARQALTDLVKGREVEIVGSKKDFFKRTLGEIKLDGKSVNLELVKLGWAWAYVEFKPPAEYVKAEADARRARLGLWADRQPTPPWEYRKSRRKNSLGAGIKQ